MSYNTVSTVLGFSDTVLTSSTNINYKGSASCHLF